ncbi:MAG: hypothetical protein V4538_01595 [Bacteroidota bacterium]
MSPQLFINEHRLARLGFAELNGINLLCQAVIAKADNDAEKDNYTQLQSNTLKVVRRKLVNENIMSYTGMDITQQLIFSDTMPNIRIYTSMQKYFGRESNFVWQDLKEMYNVIKNKRMRNVGEKTLRDIQYHLNEHNLLDEPPPIVIQ